MKNKKNSLIISMADVRGNIRIPLPTKTGGAHKRVNRERRQDVRIRLKKGEW